MPASVYSTASVRPNKPANLNRRPPSVYTTTSSRSARPAKINARSVGYCYAMERTHAWDDQAAFSPENVIAGIEAYSQGPRSSRAPSDNGSLNTTSDIQSVASGLLTTGSDVLDLTRRPCFVVGWDANENTVDVLLLATFGSRTAVKLDELTQKFVASVHPTNPYPNETSIVAETEPAWSRKPQHIVLIIHQCEARLIFPSAAKTKGKKGPLYSLSNWSDLVTEAQTRHKSFERLSDAEKNRAWAAWRQVQNKKLRNYRCTPNQTPRQTRVGSTINVMPVLLESEAGSTLSLSPPSAPSTSQSQVPAPHQPQTGSSAVSLSTPPPEAAVSMTPGTSSAAAAPPASSGIQMAAQDATNQSEQTVPTRRTQWKKEQTARMKIQRAGKTVKDAVMAAWTGMTSHGGQRK